MMGPKRSRRFRREDQGQLLILAGIVLTLGFIMTSFTLAQVSSLEREAAADKPTPLMSEWRFLHERLATNLEVGISEETGNETFTDNVFPRIAATFRNVQEEKGYDTVVRIADANFTKNEGHLVNQTSGRYEAVTPTGIVVSTDMFDGKNSGLIWKTPCPVPGPAAGCIVGVYLFVRLGDPSASMEETILFAVNQP